VKIKPIITYVCPSTTSRTVCECSSRLEKDLDIDFKQVDNVPELFPLLSNPSYHTDFICIDLEKLFDRQDNIDIFDIVNTLSTLIKCTVYRTGAGKPVKRDTKISLLIRDSTNPELIRQAMLIPEVFLGTMIGGTWDYDLVHETLKRNLNGDFAVPKHVTDLLKNKKAIAERGNAIFLTPRERQILSLIQERGASNKIIAKILDISESTVKLHIGKILKKYNCKNRTQLALFSQRASN
jgi:DNA-binding CsgD family transcriptional regulator